MEETNKNFENGGTKLSADLSKIRIMIESRGERKGEPRTKFVIKNIPRDRYEEALDLLCNYYIPDEPICQSFDVKNDREAIDDFRRDWRQTLEKGVSLGIFLETENPNESPMVGVNVLYIGKKRRDPVNDKKITFKSSKAKKMVEMFMRIQDEADIFTKYGTEIYIGAIGLTVHPNYRGHGLAKYILDARTQIGRELGIAVTATIFTGPLSQLAAERVGFKVLFEQKYVDILDDNGKMIFPVEKSKTIKVMGKRLF